MPAKSLLFPFLSAIALLALSAHAVETADFQNPPVRSKTKPLWFSNNTTVTNADRSGADFGKDKTIDGGFYDETTKYQANGRMWTGSSNEKFIAEHGFDPRPYYPALWYDIGTDTRVARNFLFGFRTEPYANGCAKPALDWCNTKGGISATVHQDQDEVVNLCNVSGDLMKCARGQHIHGIDKIGGDHPAEKFQTTIRLSAYNYAKAHVMSETYGAMGNISIDTLYQIALNQSTKGINLLIPHAVWHDDANVTFQVETGPVSLTLTNRIRDHRYFVEMSSDLSARRYFDDFIASGPAEPRAVSADMVNQVLQGPLQDPAAFYRVWLEN